MKLLHIHYMYWRTKVVSIRVIALDNDSSWRGEGGGGGDPCCSRHVKLVDSDSRRGWDGGTGGGGACTLSCEAAGFCGSRWDGPGFSCLEWSLRALGVANG